MIMNFDDVHDGAVKGQAVLQVNKASEGTTKSGMPVINVNYLVVEAEPQGESEISVDGEEFVNHTVFLPTSTDESGKVKMKKKMFKAFLKAHGFDPEGNIDTSEVVEALNSEKPQVQANLDIDNWALENRGTEQTKITRFLS